MAVDPQRDPDSEKWESPAELSPKVQFLDPVSSYAGGESYNDGDQSSFVSSFTDAWDAAEQDQQLGDLEPWEKKTILCCGGGGVRGLYQLWFLRILMRRVEKFEKSLDENTKFASSADSPLFRYHSELGEQCRPKSVAEMFEGKYLPCHYFDYCSGTSTGGIMAVMLGRLRMRVDEVLCNFERIWLTMAATMSRYDRISPFGRAKKSNSDSLDRSLEGILSDRKDRLDYIFRIHIANSDIANKQQDEFPSDPDLCRTIVIAMPDMKEDGLQKPYLFRTYSRPGTSSPLAIVRTSSGSKIEYKIGNNVLIRDVCKATSAAPGVFKGVKIGQVKFRDGATWTTNPALEICSEIEEAHDEIQDPIHLLICLGTSLRKSRKIHSQTRKSSIASPDDVLIDQLLKEKLGSKYYHFEGPRDLFNLDVNEWKIDGGGLKTFNTIREATERYCADKAVSDLIDRCAIELVRLRQSRARTSRWERFVAGIRYTCRLSPVCSSLEPFEDREAFMAHLTWEHNMPPQDEANWNQIQRLLAENQFTTIR